MEEGLPGSVSASGKKAESEPDPGAQPLPGHGQTRGGGDGDHCQRGGYNPIFTSVVLMRL